MFNVLKGVFVCKGVRPETILMYEDVCRVERLSLILIADLLSGPVPNWLGVAAVVRMSITEWMQSSWLCMQKLTEANFKM